MSRDQSALSSKRQRSESIRRGEPIKFREDHCLYDGETLIFANGRNQEREQQVRECLFLYTVVMERDTHLALLQQDRQVTHKPSSETWCRLDEVYDRCGKCTQRF
jgi:hypothetical protein